MKSKYVLGIFGICILASFVCGLIVGGFNPTLWFGHRPTSLHDNVECVIISDFGTITGHSPNINTAISERYVRNSLSHANATGGSPIQNATIYIAVGNATPATTLTKLASEVTGNGFIRVEGNVTTWYNTTANHYAFNVSAIFHASAYAGRFNCIALHWNIRSNSDNNLAAVGYITDGTYHQFDTAYTLIAKFVVTVQAY